MGRTRQASPRALAIAGGVVLVVISPSCSQSSSERREQRRQWSRLHERHQRPAARPAATPGRCALHGAPDANALFKGIPQKGLTLGKPTAPVDMEMFIDVQCPFCRDYETNNLPTIVTKYIREGKVQLTLQPWAFLGGPVRSRSAAVSA